MKQHHNFPVFTVTSAAPDNQTLIGGLDSTTYIGQRRVGDGHLGYLMHATSLIYGRWHKGKEWAFEIKESCHEPLSLSGGQQFQVLDGYWGERVALVMDKHIEWHSAKYDPKDDHAHCAICWADILKHMDYMRGSKNAVCLECYQNHIALGNYDFIQAPKQADGLMATLKAWLFKT